MLKTDSFYCRQLKQGAKLSSSKTQESQKTEGYEGSCEALSEVHTFCH